MLRVLHRYEVGVQLHLKGTNYGIGAYLRKRGQTVL